MTKGAEAVRTDRKNLTPEDYKNYRACVDMIYSPEPMDDDMIRIFEELCHTSVEQMMNDGVVYGTEEPETFESIVKKGAMMYNLHFRFNQKLGRSIYAKNGGRDDFLLHCIVSELENRIPHMADILSDYASANHLKKIRLQNHIYIEYTRTDYRLPDCSCTPPSQKELYPDFDQYLNAIFRRKDGLNYQRLSFSNIWKLGLGLNRRKSFYAMRPSKDELYIFCAIAGLSDEDFLNLRDLLVQEIDGGRLLKEDTPEKAEARRKDYLEETERDRFLLHCLSEIIPRVICAKADTNHFEADIPARLLKNLNDDLEAHGLEKLDYHKRK